MPLHVVVERSRHSKVKLFCLADKGKLVRFPDDISSPDFKDIYRLTAAAQESPTRTGEQLSQNNEKTIRAGSKNEFVDTDLMGLRRRQ